MVFIMVFIIIYTMILITFEYEPMPGPSQVVGLILRTDTDDYAEALIRALEFAGKVTSAPIRLITLAKT